MCQNLLHHADDICDCFPAGIAASSTLVDVDSSDDEPLIEIAVKGRGAPGVGADERSPPRPKSRPNSRSRDEEFTK